MKYFGNASDKKCWILKNLSVEGEERKDDWGYWNVYLLDNFCTNIKGGFQSWTQSFGKLNIKSVTSVTRMQRSTSESLTVRPIEYCIDYHHKYQENDEINDEITSRIWTRLHDRDCESFNRWRYIKKSIKAFLIDIIFGTFTHPYKTP